jgi:hypothetical protein
VPTLKSSARYVYAVYGHALYHRAEINDASDIALIAEQQHCRDRCRRNEHARRHYDYYLPSAALFRILSELDIHAVSSFVT